MSAPYTADKYITFNDLMNHLGYTPDQIKALPEVTRTRFIDWVKEANNLVETTLFPQADVIPLDKTSMVYAYAKSAALNWGVYKKRDYEGSKNANNAKNDYDRDIKLAQQVLAKTPTQRMYPIETDRTHSLRDYIVPYSQTQGFPPGLLY